MIYYFGACTLDDEREVLRSEGATVAIEPQALRVLRYLLEHRDRVVSRDELLEQCWPETYVSDASLSNCMSRVREAIGQRRGGVTLIETVHRRGYCFVGEVRAAASRSAPALPRDTALLRARGSEGEASTLLPEPPATPPQVAVGVGPPQALDDAVPAAALPSVPPTPSAVPSSPSATAERRHVSVLSCMLCGAEALAEQLDADDHYELMQGFLSRCTAVVSLYKGYVVQQSNHGVVVYFGYPQAHEDDAQRAVRSGLALVASIGRELATLAVSGPRPAVQVGIARGVVLTAPQTPPGVGRAVSQALRLGVLAEPDTVVISEATARLVSGYFVCKLIAYTTHVGGAESEVAYRVLGEGALQTPLAVRSTHGLTPFVGREAEVALLQDRWSYVQEGMGQVLWIQGEAGLGKSRLVELLKESVAVEPVLECRCSPYHQHTAFYPLIDLIQRALLAQSGSPGTPLEHLEILLVQYDLGLDEAVPLLAGLLSLDLPKGRYASLNLPSQRQRERTLEVLWSLLQIQAAASPLLFVVEDVHWIDPSTLEFLQLVLTQVASMSMLLVLTSRPAFVAPWGPRAEITPVALNRLTRAQTEAMIVEVVGGKPLPPTVLAQIVEKTDGVPLFVEELTRMVLESGQLMERQGRYELRGELSALTIPLTLHDSLIARLDRLGAGKDIAQWGAVLGREFSDELLEAVTPYDETTLRDGLRELVASELVFQRGLAPQTRYRFKHALIQDAAYDALPRRRRQAMHGQVAQVLDRQLPQLVETQPEVLAHHYTEAGLTEQAIPYWQRAGQQAAQRSANQEAMGHLTQGLELLGTLPDSPERTQQELDFQTVLGPALMVTKGFGHPEVEQAYARARELCQQVGNTPERFPVLYGLWRFYRARAELQTAREIGEQLLTLAQRQDDPTIVLAAHVALGTTLYFMGAFRLARMHLEQGIAKHTLQPRRTSDSRYGQDPGVQCHHFLAWTLWCLGYPEQAMRRSHEGLALAQELAHPASQTMALWGATRLRQLRRDVSETHELAEATITVSAEQGNTYHLAYGTTIRGWALFHQRQRDEGIKQMHQGLAVMQTVGGKVARLAFLALLADAYGTAGQADKGLPLLAESMTIMDKNGQRYYAAELNRLQGKLFLQQAAPDASQAETCFQQALDIARQQEARSWELRTATSLARLWQSQDRHQEAYELLAPIYEWFTEGFDTADLKDAKGLLEELSRSLML